MDLSRRQFLEAAGIAVLSGCAQPGVPAKTTLNSFSEKDSRVQTQALFNLRLSTAPVQAIGAGPHGTRVTFPITGGSFEGARLRGKVLPGGDDWTIQRGDGVIELDLRVTLETDDGAHIYMTFEGIRDDGAAGVPYFRTLPRFETAAPQYAYLNKLLAVGRGVINPEGPLHVIEEIL